jgi:hypothetical protein
MPFFKSLVETGIVPLVWLDWMQLDWMQLDWVELDWVELDWTR